MKNLIKAFGAQEFQKLLQEKIQQEAKVNVVTCPDCGDVFFHPLEIQGNIVCPHCEAEGEACDFPDFYY